MEIQGRTTTIFAPLETMRGIPGDINVTTREAAPEPIQIHGILRPYLYPAWKTVRIENFVTGQVIDIKTRYPISWLMDHQIRNILKEGTLTCILVYVNQHKLHRVFIKVLDDEIAEEHKSTLRIDGKRRNENKK